jgi:hypothetical protein
MKKMAGKIGPGMILLLGLVILLAGCAGGGNDQVKQTTCSGAIEWQICKVAEIENFACELGTFKKKPALVYTVAIRNTDAKPHRYRLNIFLLDQDKAAGHLVPRKGKPPVVKPGATATVKVPFFKATAASSKMLVVVKTIGE